MNAGIYIHVPFCHSKCDYCSFVSRPWDDSLAERYWRAVVRELHEFAAGSTREDGSVDTVYFGGGTPSLIPARQIASILETCRTLFRFSADAEISLEANPGTLEGDKLEIYRAIGVNRISLGAQSFSDDELLAIGRIHTAEQIRTSLELLRDRGFRNISLDLMLGLPGQTQAGWIRNLESAVSLAPSHISVYMLELDPKVPLYHSVKRGAVRIPDDDSLADWYLQTLELLDRRGYAQYEISNFAHAGCECRHNLKYWRREPVLAFGVAAHSHDGTARYANVANLAGYLQAVEEARSPREWREEINAGRGLEENLYLGLRLTQGIDWDQIRQAYAPDLVKACEGALKELAELGLVEREGSVVRLTRRGMLLSNEVFQRFVEVHSRET